MTSGFLARALSLAERRGLKRMRQVVDHVNALSGDAEALSDAELKRRTGLFRSRYAQGESLEAFLPEAFATVREAAWRVLSQRPFDVQVMGGIALHFGNIAEMMTGEGKTLACVLPAYLNAISGKGVHIVTVNDYLARRDSDWMGRVHRFLGVDVGVILTDMTPTERRAAYNADITYGTNSEFGFDYLRDNMALSQAETVQRGYNYAIVDEVDSILIDEARTPLIISGPADPPSVWYDEFARIADVMELDRHYEIDTRKKTVAVSEEGVAFVEDQLGLNNLYQPEHSVLVGCLNNAVKAKELFLNDRDYIVRGGEVLIVDEFTGRVLKGRRYNEGLHQAIEAKEGVEVQAENQTLATITLQNYFRLYDKLAGMTGTASTEADEFRQTYRLGVVTIPPNKPSARLDGEDVVYRTERAKFNAVVDDIVARHKTGQPVLVGTISVAKSEYLARKLAARTVPHTVLNAKHPEQEAAIVAVGGRRGAVTVATDMAGRGTDIVLGGNVDFLTDIHLRGRGLSTGESPESYEKAWQAERPAIEAAAAAEAAEVRALGGLYVVGTERHESRRIDNQLRGRCGRQGDPGETRFYLSLGDDLMRRFSDVNLPKLLKKLKMPEDEPIRAGVVTRAIRGAQTQVEQVNFELRRNVLKYDEVMNEQRKVVYAARRRILDGDDLREQSRNMVSDVVTAYVMGATAGRPACRWDLATLWTALQQLYPVGIDEFSVPQGHLGRRRTRAVRMSLVDMVTKDAQRAFDELESQVNTAHGGGAMRQYERQTILEAIDRRWRGHLYEMDYLKEGIGLRAVSQRDPVVEYRREGYDMFAGMVAALKEDCVTALFLSGSAPAD